MDEDPAAIARSARLRYVTDRDAGIRRQRRGSGFSFSAPRTVRLERHRERIRKLAIPPAWKDVWICPDPRGHLQATGVDARGRLQYRYHAEWRIACDQRKFARIAAFGRHLPAVRRRVNRDLASDGLSKPKVLAAIVRLLESSLIRVGNEEYARNNGSFGLTTLRKRHVDIKGRAHLHFRFIGKSSIEHQIRLFAPRVADVIRRCQKLPGRDLFQYQQADGTTSDVTAADVNEYLAEIGNAPLTAKDFRTWGATVLLHGVLSRRPPPGSQRERARELRAALGEVAGALGNTVTVCRASYVHPAVPRAYLAGGLPPTRWKPPVFGRVGLSAVERATLHLLEESLS